MGMIDTLKSVVRFKPIERDPVERRLSKSANIDDLRRIAKRRLPRGVFDYIDGGAEDESALARNTYNFANYTFKPRVLRDVGEVDTSSTLLGKPLDFPLITAPTGFGRIAHPLGELAVARSADQAGIPFCLSTMATRSIEECAQVNPTGRKWFQVYVWKDRGLVKDMIERADRAGYEALCVTVDTAQLGRRERDVRRGYTLPPKLGLDTIVDGIIHPGWTLDFLRNDPILFANVAVSRPGEGDGGDAISLAEYTAAQFDPSLNWGDLEWMRSVWSGQIVIKGVQTVEDARIAVEHGVDAVCLSNHGGRQLDHAPAIIDLVAPVAQAVGGESEIICDGGIRRGSDIVKALALGADACMAGRAYLYGLGAAGPKGVDHVFDFLRDGMAKTMALVGANTVSELTPELLEMP